MEDIVFNDLDDPYLDLICGDQSAYVYQHWLPSDSGWDWNYFNITDFWSVSFYPQLYAHYETGGKEFIFTFDFLNQEFNNVCGYDLRVDGELLFSKTNVNMTLDDFFVMSPSGKFLDGSEEKCINLINRYWNLKAFL